MIAKNGKLLSCCITGMGLRIELGAHKTKGEEYTKKRKKKPICGTVDGYGFEKFSLIIRPDVVCGIDDAMVMAMSYMYSVPPHLLCFAVCHPSSRQSKSSSEMLVNLMGL